MVPLEAPSTTGARQTAPRSLQKALGLLRSDQTLEGTVKDSIEYLQERALENLGADAWHQHQRDIDANADQRAANDSYS